jgi:hypothetical protein
VSLVTDSPIDASLQNSGSDARMESFWSHKGAPHPWHFVVAVYYAVGFVVARFFFDKFIFRVRFLLYICFALDHFVLANSSFFMVIFSLVFGR